MAKKFYVLDSSKSGSRADGNGNYRLLVGSEIKTFFDGQRKSDREFIYQRQPNGDVIGIEVPKEKRKEVKAEKNRQAYIRRVMQEMDISILSLDSMIVGENEGTGEEIIPDESADLESQFIQKEEIETLREALGTLSEEELYIVNSLYLTSNPTSERELARQLKIPKSTFNRRKLAILAKIKNFF